MFSEFAISYLLAIFNTHVIALVAFSYSEREQTQSKVQELEQPVIRKKPVVLREMSESIVIENLAYGE